jgi:hypothetical protein
MPMQNMNFVPRPSSKPCGAILDHWQALRGDRLRPRRSEIDPGALVPFLPNIGIFQVISPEVTLCRLAGTAFHRSLGFELTGRNVAELYGPTLYRTAGYRFQLLATQPCGAMFDLVLQFASGAENPHEIMLLPLEPEEPGASPTLLVGAAPIRAVEWENTAVLPQLEPSPNFRFIDIGAGIPTSLFPPDDFGKNASG